MIGDIARIIDEAADVLAARQFPLTDLLLALASLPALEGALRGRASEGRLLWTLGLFVRALTAGAFNWLFHVDGLAAEVVNLPAHLLIPAPDGISWAQAACASVTFGTVEHMLFDNARLEGGETILVHAAGSGVGSTAILMAKDIGATVFATAGDDEKLAKATALGADHVINYRTDRFEGVVRRLTAKRGVDVVFEHVGPATWAGSMFSLTKGGRLVTCGSTSGISTDINLFQLFQQQIRIFGSFGASIRNVADGLAKMGAGRVLPVIDSEIPMAAFGKGLERLESRQVFGKIIVHIP